MRPLSWSCHHPSAAGNIQHTLAQTKRGYVNEVGCQGRGNEWDKEALVVFWGTSAKVFERLLLGHSRSLPILRSQAKVILGNPVLWSGCVALGGPGLLRLLWGGNGTDLLHQAQGIPVLPLLHDLALFDAMDSDPSDSHLIARRSDTHQFALVRTLCPPTANNLLPLSYILLQRYAQVGEGGTDHGDELPQTLYATNIFVGFVHNDGVSVHFLEGII